MIDRSKRVLVVGGAGYLGSVLSARLFDAGYEVTIFDRLTFGREPIADLMARGCRLIHADLQDAERVARAVSQHDAVILLAGLVGEKACAQDPERTVAINLLGCAVVLEACRYYRTLRFIFASTDSCYGIQTGIITESNPLAPISLYAETKKVMEQRILTAWNEDRAAPAGGEGPQGFGPVILRMGTLYGFSPRMRFDLVVNLLTWKASAENVISIYGGEQWRPFVHVADAAEAYVLALEAPPERVLGEVFNVGTNNQNIQIRDLGRLVAEEFPGVETRHVDQPPDLRDYYVDCSKIDRVLGWRARRTLRDGVREIREAILSGRFGTVLDPIYQNA